MLGSYAALQVIGRDPPTLCDYDPYWPAAVVQDAYFSNVVLLLHGDGADASTTFIDYSPSSKAVTAFGNAQVDTSQSKFGGASIQLDGTDDYLSTPGTSAFAFGTSDFCIEAWIRPTAASGTHSIFTNRATFGADYGVWLYHSTGLVASAWGPTAGTIACNIGGGTLTAGAWQHVAFTRSGSTFTLWLDGVSVATSSSASSIVDGGLPVYVGRDPSVTPTRDFNGWIDDVRVTIGAARYTSTFSPPIAAHPNFYQTQSTLLSLHCNSLVDSSSTPKTIAAIGSASISATLPKFGAGSLLIPVSPQSALSVSPATDFQFAFGQPFTVEFWVKLVAAPSGEAYFVCLGGPGSGAGNAPVRSGWAVSVGAARLVSMSIGDLSLTKYNSATTIAALTLGVWTHIAASFNGSSAPLIFFDGVLKPTTIFTGTSWSVVTPAETDSTLLYVGQYDKRAGGSAIVPLSAYIDELRVTGGISRYAANFTPQALEFCDTGNLVVAPPAAAPNTLPVVFAPLTVGPAISMSGSIGAAPLRPIAIAAGAVTAWAGPRPGGPITVPEVAASLPVWVIGDLPYSVDWQTYDITAVAGVNYTAASGSITAVTEWTERAVAILAAGAATYGNPPLKFGIRLLNPGAGSALTVGADHVEVTITDSTPRPTLSFTQTQLSSVLSEFVFTLSSPVAYAFDFTIAAIDNRQAFRPWADASMVTGVAVSFDSGASYATVAAGLNSGVFTVAAGVTTFRVRVSTSPQGSGGLTPLQTSLSLNLQCPFESGNYGTFFVLQGALPAPTNGSLFGVAANRTPPYAQIKFLPDGTVMGQRYTGERLRLLGNWYSPTTPGIGAFYNVRATLDPGSDTPDSGPVGVWTSLGGFVDWSSSGESVSMTYEVAWAAPAGPAVGGGFLYLETTP